MRVDALALDGVFDLGLPAALDAFQTANELIEMSSLAAPRFEVRIVGIRKAIKTSQGLNVPVHSVGTRTPDCSWFRRSGLRRRVRWKPLLAGRTCEMPLLRCGNGLAAVQP
jgi:hypothetical protein